MTRLLLTIILSSLLIAGASARERLPEDLRWNSLPEAGADSAASSSLGRIAPGSSAGVSTDKDSTPDNRNWWYLFKKGKLSMSDTTVQWPGFLGFCVKVYNWGDRVFSSTDTAYVIGTGKRWRARVINDNWTDSYYMRFSKDFNSIMTGNFHVLAGASLQYMAVSYSYLYDISHAVTGSPIDYRKQEFGFNCARFSIDGYYNSNKGGTYVRTFGDYDSGHMFRKAFSGIEMTQFGLDGYYFVNGYKYSQAAAYNFSKIQKKSQGCVLVGLAYCNQNIDIDFSKLPPELMPYLKLDEKKYHFHYNDYNLLVGYGYNAVMGRHWLYNITAIPGIGFNHSYEDSTEGNIKLFSLSARAMTSFTYNNGNWFAGLQAKIRGNWYQSTHFGLFNTVQSIVLSGGYRF